MQTQPLVRYPSDWTDHPPTIVGAVGLQRVLRRLALGETGETAGEERGTMSDGTGRPSQIERRPAGLVETGG
jgi:hypothetical protein